MNQAEVRGHIISNSKHETDYWKVGFIESVRHN